VRRGLCIWFTGLPCSGKTTISRRLTKAVEARGKTVTLLDADEIRPILCPDLRYSDEDRLKNMMRLAFVAREIVRHGGIVIVATVSPCEAHRQKVRQQFEPSSFVQVWVNTPLTECERRDVKGMYALARKSEIPQFTGVSAPYEEPAHSDVVCETVGRSTEECVAPILEELDRRAAMTVEQVAPEA
jgi:adenylyl-sulfate kinase